VPWVRLPEELHVVAQLGEERALESLPATLGVLALQPARVAEAEPRRRGADTTAGDDRRGETQSLESERIHCA
jgi:hypothetical protein